MCFGLKNVGELLRKQNTIFVKHSNSILFETFYLINANESLNDLVKLMSRYDNVNAKGRMKLGKLIEKELDALNPENMGDLASIGSRLDKPIVGGVAFRGEGDAIKDLSLTDQCVGKYGVAYKQIILNHK